jgi:hypothetical protein
VLAGLVRSACVSLEIELISPTTSSYKTRPKRPFSLILWQIGVHDPFWDPSRGFKVLCSIHSTAFETEATRSEPRSMEFKSESVHSHL